MVSINVNLLLLIALGSCALKSFALPTPAPCHIVISGTEPSTSCNILSPADLGELRTSTKLAMGTLRGEMNQLHTIISSHPDYLCLTEVQRGANTGLNPQVNQDYAELGKAAIFLQNCFYNKLHNFSNTENQLKMRGSELEFADQLHNASGHLVPLIRNLRNLTRSDESLSQGSGQCIIPVVGACPEPDWATAGQVSAHQDRLRKLANFAISLFNYLNGLYYNPYWPPQN